MNKLSAVIITITRCESLCYLELDASGIPLVVLLFDPPPIFRKGSRVKVLFKESEVALAKGCSMESSFSNIFSATITAIVPGQILAEISLQSRAGKIVSIITLHAALRLELKEKDEVTLLIKASQLSLEALQHE